MRTRCLFFFSLFLASCSAEDDDGLVLDGRVFVSESVEGRELVAGTQVRLSFEANELSASAGCNGMFGHYSLEGDVLVVAGMGSTEIGCEPPLHDQDEWLAGFLQDRPTAEFVDPELTLTTSDVTMRLVDREIASPDRPLVGPQWIGNGIGDGETVMGGSSFDLLTIRFGADGLVEAFSGCQHGSGGFVEGDGTISFTELVYDGEPCTDPAMEELSEAFLFVLDGSDVSFEIEEYQLKIEREGTTLYFGSSE